MSLFSKLFGGGQKPEPKSIAYKGFDIFPDPIAEAGKYRLSARIEKTVDGARQSVSVIRADVFESREQAEDISTTKAKQVVDEQGDRMFASKLA